MNSLSVETAVGKLTDEWNILIADDHPVFCFGLQGLLKHISSADIDFAENGLQVLEKLKSKRYDVIFLDIDMPVMNGIEALRKIRELNYNVPIVIVSLHAQEAYFMETYRLGISGYILKNTNMQLITTDI